MPETFLILRCIHRDVIKLWAGLHVKYRYCSQILMKCEFCGQILKGIQILIFMKIRIVEGK